MAEQRQAGFTVIEVLMFLAISALLLIGAFAAVSSSINSSRFNDSVNSTVSNLQKQYAEVLSGRNSRNASLGCAGGVVDASGSTAGMTNCVVLGRLIQFDVGGSTLSSRYIVGRDSTSQSTSDTAAVRLAVPRAVSGNGLNESFDVPWSAIVDAMTSGGADVNYLAMIRSPISERILLYSFQAPDGLTTLTDSHISDSNLNQPVDICLLDTGSFPARRGYIRIGAGQGQDIIRADLSSTTGVCS